MADQNTQVIINAILNIGTQMQNANTMTIANAAAPPPEVPGPGPFC